MSEFDNLNKLEKEVNSGKVGAKLGVVVLITILAIVFIGLLCWNFLIRNNAFGVL